MSALQDPLDALLKQIRACEVCAPHLAHAPRPVLRASASARLCIVGQAPGTRVQETGIPFNDRSGQVLRDWLGLTPEEFYDDSKVAIVPMGFCFPGTDAKGADRPPRRECAPLWRERLFALLPNIALTAVIGQYAQAWHLKERRFRSVTETVAHWRDFGTAVIPLPHPSWRNLGWLRANPWFARDVLPDLKVRVKQALGGGAVG